MTDGLAVVVVDERRLVREGVASLLSSTGCVVSASYASLNAILVDLEDLPAGVVVILGQLTGLSAGKFSPKLRTVQLTDSFAELLASVHSGSPAKTTGSSSSVVLAPPAQRFSVRERQILELIAQGMSAGEMAKSLGVSRSTIEHHKQQMFARVGVQSQAHAVALSRQALSLNDTAG